MSKKYEVVVSYSGYSRGTQIWKVEAESEEEAKESYWDGQCVHDVTVRDDREGEVDSVEEL